MTLSSGGNVDLPSSACSTTAPPLPPRGKSVVDSGKGKEEAISPPSLPARPSTIVSVSGGGQEGMDNIDGVFDYET
jgi:hypothetical protein